MHPWPHGLIRPSEMTAYEKIWKVFLFLNITPIPSMYGTFNYIYHKHQPNVGKYTLHGSYGCWKDLFLPSFQAFIFRGSCFSFSKGVKKKRRVSHWSLFNYWASFEWKKTLWIDFLWFFYTAILPDNNISHLGKRKIIFKHAVSRGYVSSLEANFPRNSLPSLKSSD